jgi:hypothetical protein
VYCKARVSYGLQARDGPFVAPYIPRLPRFGGATVTGPQMDPELRPLDRVRRHWWLVVIVLYVIWAIECHLEGNSVIETIEAPLLVVAWGGLILLIDRWALRHIRGVS